MYHTNLQTTPLCVNIIKSINLASRVNLIDDLYFAQILLNLDTYFAHL